MVTRVAMRLKKAVGPMYKYQEEGSEREGVCPLNSWDPEQPLKTYTLSNPIRETRNPPRLRRVRTVT